MTFVDTHCHIQFADYGLPVGEVLEAARAAGVTRLICVGTTLADSRQALEFAGDREGVFASVGIHPHEAATFLSRPASRGELEAVVMSRPPQAGSDR